MTSLLTQSINITLVLFLQKLEANNAMSSMLCIEKLGFWPGVSLFVK